MDKITWFINECRDCHKLTDDEFYKKIVDIYDEFSDESDMYKCLNKCIFEFYFNGSDIYRKFKILLDYSCKNFNLKYNDFIFKKFPKIQKIETYKIIVGSERPCLCFSINYYFKGYQYAISQIDPKDYYDIYEIGIIDESQHKSNLKQLQYVKTYFGWCLADKRYDEIDKCFNYGYRPSTKTFNYLSDTGMLVFSEKKDIENLLEILKKYNISHDKIIKPITQYLIETFDSECLEFCLDQGININFDTEQLFSDHEVNFIQKLINLGLSAIDIANVVKKHKNY